MSVVLNRSRIVLVCVVILLACGVAGCGVKEALDQEKKMKPLAARRASRQEVIQLLGTNYIVYSDRNNNWHLLTNYLAKEPNDRLADVRVRAAKCSTVLLYSTPYVATWVFLDNEERVVDYLVSAQ